jgi:(2R)-ethylmalonyl-CoA mutase
MTGPSRRRRWPSFARGRARKIATSCRSSIAAAQAGVTTGEWTETLRAVSTASIARPPGSRGAAAVSDGPEDDRAARPRRPKWPSGSAGRSSSWSASPASTAIRTGPSRSRCKRARLRHGSGLRGHPPDAGAASSMRRWRKACTSSGLSILSGSHVPLATEVIERMNKCGSHRRRACHRRRHHPAGGRRSG